MQTVLCSQLRQFQNTSPRKTLASSSLSRRASVAGPRPGYPRPLRWHPGLPTRSAGVGGRTFWWSGSGHVPRTAAPRSSGTPNLLGGVSELGQRRRYARACKGRLSLNCLLSSCRDRSDCSGSDRRGSQRQRLAGCSCDWFLFLLMFQDSHNPPRPIRRYTFWLLSHRGVV